MALQTNAMMKPTSVRLIAGVKSLSKWNIIWEPKWPMSGGKFPKTHPCHANQVPLTSCDQPATTDPLGVFRGLGQSNASCFPEGDGICFDVPDGKSFDDVAKDVEASFGWKPIARRRQ